MRRILTTEALKDLNILHSLHIYKPLLFIGSKCVDVHEGVNAVWSLMTNGLIDVPPHIFYFGSFTSYEPCEEACRQVRKSSHLSINFIVNVKNSNGNIWISFHSLLRYEKKDEYEILKKNLDTIDHRFLLVTCYDKILWKISFGRNQNVKHGHGSQMILRKSLEESMCWTGCSSQHLGTGAECGFRPAQTMPLW